MTWLSCSRCHGLFKAQPRNGVIPVMCRPCRWLERAARLVRRSA